MNHIHRLIWNSDANTWVAVAENARGRGKSSGRKLVAAALSLVFTCAQAEPLGGVVASGTGTITQAGSATTIVQTTPNLSLNWKSFNVGAAESVKFVQPSANSVAVNRIFDTNGSQILGRLSANGQVYLINPNGILFGKGAQVNVGGLVASTLGFNDASLGANARVFSGSSLGSVVNLGSITTAEGGFVALLGNTVSNQGTITAPRGKVMLGGASAATLNFANNALVSMKIDQSVFNTLVENGGLIKADGGSVALTAGTQTSKAPGVVRQVGYIQARTLNNQNGIITLLSGMATGTVYVDGTLDASAPQGGNGGFIETSAAKVRIGNDVKVSTAAAKGLSGKWLIDPTDFTISAIDPGNGDGFMSSATLATSLTKGDVAIQTSAAGSGNGDINVNDTVSWAANKLTLTAAGNININAPLKGSVKASLAFEYGQGAAAADNTSNYVINAPVDLPTGLNFSTKLGNDGTAKLFTVVNSLGKASDAAILTMPAITTLQALAAAPNLSGNFVLGGNIDAQSTSAFTYNGLTGFIPIGNNTVGNRFTGMFDGLGHTINKLTINLPGIVDVGLFSTTDIGSIIQNVALTGGSVTGATGTGGLVGNNYGVINKSSNTGTVNGGSNTGGLIGLSDLGSISNSFSTGPVFGAASTGGLVGNTFGSIRTSYATGAVSGGANTGGLAGTVAGHITNSYSTGVVKGAAVVGGLVGFIIGNVSDSYNRGDVTGTTPVGGLVGYTLNGNIRQSFNSGAVRGADATGGLVGLSGLGYILDSYNTGNVVGSAQTGGLAGNFGTGSISSSFNTGSVTGMASTGGLAGLSSTPDISNSFNSGNIAGAGAVGGLAGTTAGNITNSYASGKVSGAGSGGLAGLNSGKVTSSYWDKSVGPAISSNGGSGLTTADMLLQASYVDWDFPKTWTINNGVTSPGVTSLLNFVSVTGNNTSRVYDSTPYFGGNGVVYSSMPFGFVPGTVSYIGDAQNAVNVRPGGYAITPQITFKNPQYVVTYISGNLNITPAPLTIGAPTVSRDYDGTPNVPANLFMLLGLKNGENLGFVTGVGTMVDKNVGVDKPVTFSGLISLSDGSGAGKGLASNYTVTAGAPMATVTRLPSVTYTGNGNTSNWFDPANWGGAVPDLTNVANVVIPAGFNVSFNNASPVLPAESSPVNLDSLTSSGALSLVAGTLNVAKAMTLPALSQSGGSLLGTGSLTVSQSFTQTSGTIKIGGDVALTQPTGTLVVKSLEGRNITLTSNNDIQLGDLAAAGKLTLEYGQGTSLGGSNDYFVKAPLNLNAGLNFSTKLGSDGAVQDFQVITRLGDAVDVTLPPALTTLQGLANSGNLNGKYVLGSNIDASLTASASYNGTDGFIPIGNATQSFSGVFDGLGHTVSGLMISLPTTANVGLFGVTVGSSTIQNVGLLGGSVVGSVNTGGLVGNNDNGTIRNSFNTGNVTGGAGTGGLVGHSAAGNVSTSYATGLVAGAVGSGGLVGTMDSGTISNSYAKGKVTGGASTGGLVGKTAGPVIESYATGNVTGTDDGIAGAAGALGVGGLIGASSGLVTISYATGDISGGAGVGGLLGTSTGIVSDTFATGSVTANSNAGGLMGNSTNTVSNSYATGKVTTPVASATTGALMGTSTGTLSHNFWESTVNPLLPGIGTMGIAGGATALSSADMLIRSNFTKATAANGQVAPGWDFDKVWSISPGTKPLLVAFLATPTAAPTSAPTTAPTSSPTVAPTAAPTSSPTTAPTAAPTSSPTRPSTDFGQSGLDIFIENTKGNLVGDLALNKFIIAPQPKRTIKVSYLSAKEAAIDAAKLLISNEIKLQIIDEGMQLTQTLFFPDEDEEEELRRLKRALITK